MGLFGPIYLPTVICLTTNNLRLIKSGQIAWTLVQRFNTMNCITFYAQILEEVDGAYWFRIVRACVGLSVQEPSCMLGFWNFIYGFLMEKYLTHIFFLYELSPFLELCAFEKIWTKSDACHILWTVHAGVLKFHIWISHGKIADPYFFSCPSYLSFWSYAPLKKSAWNLVSKISRKVFELGAWNMVSL